MSYVGKGSCLALDEKEVDVRIEEVDAAISQLQKRRQDLFEIKQTANATRVLASLSWKSFKGGKEGEWTFLTDPQGNLVKELEPIKDFVQSLTKDKRVTVGEYGYNVSENKKFLHRYAKPAVRTSK